MKLVTIAALLVAVVQPTGLRNLESNYISQQSKIRGALRKTDTDGDNHLA